MGQTRLAIEFTGHANHAGTTPMHLRRDALAGAAEWLSAVESLALHTEGLVATVGKLDVEPNVANVIAGAARVSLDVRHAADAERESAVGTLLDQAESIAAKRGLTLKCTRQMDQPAVPMDERLTAILAAAIEVSRPAREAHDQRRRPRRHGHGCARTHGHALLAQPRRHQPSSR